MRVAFIAGCASVLFLVLVLLSFAGFCFDVVMIFFLVSLLVLVKLCVLFVFVHVLVALTFCRWPCVLSHFRLDMVWFPLL